MSHGNDWRLMMDDKLYLGTGWAFPAAFRKDTGALLTNGDEDIRQSLGILISTVPGEHIFRPDYGCNIRQWIFSKMSLSEKTLIADTIQQAIRLGEPRITISSVDLEVRDIHEGILWIQIAYTVNATNSPDNVVFPFYFTEGKGM